MYLSSLLLTIEIVSQFNKEAYFFGRGSVWLALVAFLLGTTEKNPYFDKFNKIECYDMIILFQDVVLPNKKYLNNIDMLG